MQMKLSKLVSLVAIGFLVAGFGVGCKNKYEKGITKIGGYTVKPPGDEDPSRLRGGNPLSSQPRIGATTLDTGPTGGVPQTGNPDDWDNNYNHDRSIFSGETVHFEFDKASVRASDVAKVEKVASHLKSNPTHRVTVEGHCDERGTEEYNRSLGERRALAVREKLIQFGISYERIRTISYGEDKPIASGHDEPSWAQNRRGEFILATPK